MYLNNAKAFLAASNWIEKMRRQTKMFNSEITWQMRKSKGHLNLGEQRDGVGNLSE